MIERTFDAARVNEIVNHPSVYPWVHGALDGPLDLSSEVRNPANVVLLGEHGGLIYYQHQPGQYEVHTQVLPEGRGAWALEMARESLRYMFTRTDAVEIATRVPQGNVPAMALTKRVGMELDFSIEQGWCRRGKVIPADVFSLSISRWIRTAPGIADTGRWFWNRIGEERGVPVPAGDRSDDRHVGAAVEMLMRGQPHKSVVFFNRWAALAGVLPISILTTNPLTAAWGDSMLVVRNNDFWIS